MVAVLVEPDSKWTMLTEAPATPLPSAPTTWPPTDAVVFCAIAGAAATIATATLRAVREKPERFDQCLLLILMTP